MDNTPTMNPLLDLIPEHDPFDSLLNLEADYYQEGYQLGVTDGTRTGRLEGRASGLEIGFEKYITMGTLRGRAAVWSSRYAQGAATDGSACPESVGGEDRQTGVSGESRSAESGGERNDGLHISTESDQPQLRLPGLISNPRMEKHIKNLQALVEPASLPTENSEDAGAEFEDRLRRATAKIKVIEKGLGEGGRLEGGDAGSHEHQGGRKRVGEDEKNMEDFEGRIGL